MGKKSEKWDLLYFPKFVLLLDPNSATKSLCIRLSTTGGGRQMCTPLIHLINPIITWFLDFDTLITGSLEPVFSNPLLVLSVPLLVLSFPAPLVLPNNSLHFKGIYRYNLVEITNSSRKNRKKNNESPNYLPPTLILTGPSVQDFLSFLFPLCIFKIWN